MTLSSISGPNVSAYLAPTRSAAPQKESDAASAPADGFSASVDEAGLALIPSNLAAQGSEAAATFRATSPQLLQAQGLAGDVAAASVPGFAPLWAAASDTEKTEILSLFDNWNNALQTGNPDKVVEQYAPDAILLPTVSNKVRHNHAEIKDYFVHFMAKGPKGHIDESNIRTFGDLAINSGVYTFDFANGDSVQARYTFVYERHDGEWKITEHHSSAMPEKTPHAA